MRAAASRAGAATAMAPRCAATSAVRTTHSARPGLQIAAAIVDWSGDCYASAAMYLLVRHDKAL